ncbi:MAG: ABC transporter ATP-binding protein [Candidatus Thermoplasmatota archaeon]|nr:ABC transporter ATP-binding protein [Candidatus Thermoplasmatota archaeon]
MVAEEIKRYDERIEELKQEEASLRSLLLKDYLSYSFMRRILRRKYEKPYKDIARRRAIELLTEVNIAGPERVLDSYPHELSGGMQQRSMIAMALSSNPKILIADEPTTSLDVTTQAQILDLLKEISHDTNMTILFITHDLAVVAEMCNRVGVMYGGNIVEEADVKQIFRDAKHPYTTGLMNSIPRAERRFDKSQRLESIPGTVPNLIEPPSGCRFHPRCKFKMDICSEQKPRLVEIEEGHKVACFLYSDEVEEEPVEEIP